jgi:hypothetical protein
MFSYFFVFIDHDINISSLKMHRLKGCEICLCPCLTQLFCFTFFRSLSYCLDYVVLFHGFYQIDKILSDYLIYGFISYRQKRYISFAEYNGILGDAGRLAKDRIRKMMGSLPALFHPQSALQPRQDLLHLVLVCRLQCNPHPFLQRLCVSGRPGRQRTIGVLYRE